MHADEQARLDAWMGIVSAHATVMRVVEPDLKDNHELSGAQYEILRRLAHEPEGRMRMKPLAESILYGSGAATNLVSRLVQRGLVTRQSDCQDGRGVWVHLTEEGRELINRARASQKRLSVEQMPSFASDEERDTVLGYLDRVVGKPFERVSYLPSDPEDEAASA